MIQLAWRQFRAQAAAGYGPLLLLAIAAVLTGPHLAHLYDTLAPGCQIHQGCQSADLTITSYAPFLQDVWSALLLAVPVLTGIFWAAPLIAREFETGTFRLAWTQSVTRARWLAVKLGLVGLASVAVSGLFSLMVTWWFSPIDRVNQNRFLPVMFDERGIVAFGYAAFAFALGATAGLFIRRTVPAMAATLAGFIAVRLGFTFWVRPHLMSPVHADVPLGGTSGGGVSVAIAQTRTGLQLGMPTSVSLPNAWVYSSQVAGDHGQPLTSQAIAAACPAVAHAAAGQAPGSGGLQHAPGGGPGAYRTCIAHLAARFHIEAVYQPASRYWAFQALETAIFALAGLLLAGLCWWRLTRRGAQR